ncbi:MAG: carbamoyltransferase HypF [Chloroflexota bacterium]
MALQGAVIHITGIVQGVGFRPFVYNLAQRLALAGWVRNTSAGVDIEVDGTAEGLQAFVQALRAEAPALASIDDLEVQWRQPAGFQGFEIVHSQAVEAAFQPISPDVCICEDCLRELFDPQDRRYRYPFINCTNCGPRFTIIQDIPYDRPNTTMSVFPMCLDCSSEYQQPSDRRFHAQPVACPDCGPLAWFEQAGSAEQVSAGDQAIRQAREWLRQGRILAIKGLGGFHLACDATNQTAVAELRRRKLRVDKPFALMFPDLPNVAAHCLVSPAEAALLASRQRPIVILQRRPGADSQLPAIAAEVTPGQATIGAMLPYTPLHYLLFADPEQSGMAFDMPPLVMTSGNLSEEPICTGNEQARRHLGSLADGFLMHDREIYIRCDDSVVRASPVVAAKGDLEKALYPIRRSRGYAPEPVRLPVDTPPLLATGAELKNTFCLARQRYAFLSHHIGDMENYETLRAFEDGIVHFERLFRVQPEVIAYDLHPNYLATRYALQRAEQEGLPAIGVQHHHAHIAACMAENGLTGDAPVIGVSFDGTGFGDDEAIWGGEFLVADYASYQRAAHLAYVPQPGGDKAVREPWRMALAWLQHAGIEWDVALPPVHYAAALAEASIQPLNVLRQQLKTGLNAPLTSSVGRLFDAAAALIGVQQVVNYEAQAAIELEALVDPGEPRVYTIELQGDVVDPAPMLRHMVTDLRTGVSLPRIAARFHGAVAVMVVNVCQGLRKRLKIHQVALSGGVWQNAHLLERTTSLLEKDGFTVYTHSRVPANDGGLSLGQALVANARLKA